MMKIDFKDAKVRALLLSILVAILGIDLYFTGYETLGLVFFILFLAIFIPSLFYLLRERKK